MAWAIQWDGHNANSIIILYEEKKVASEPVSTGSLHLYVLDLLQKISSENPQRSAGANPHQIVQILVQICSCGFSF